MRKAEPEMTAAIRIVHLSDTHLSATHAYFEDNWHAVREAVIAERPDLVLHGGDLCFNAPANPDDLAFAAAQLRSLGVPWLAVAGNHDVGEAPGFSRLAQPLTDARIAAWRAHVGPSWWWRDIGAWRIVGIDTALLASGRPEEVEQTAFLREALGTRGVRPVLLVLHMPAFHDDPADPAFTTREVPYPARGALLDLCVEGGVKVMLSGHLHVHRRFRHRGMEMLWAPTTAMVDSRARRGRKGCPRPGFLVLDIVGTSLTHRLVEPERAFIIDMKGWTAPCRRCRCAAPSLSATDQSLRPGRNPIGGPFLTRRLRSG
jgi:predicted phosphodiesterase